MHYLVGTRAEGIQLCAVQFSVKIFIEYLTETGSSFQLQCGPKLTYTWFLS